MIYKNRSTLRHESIGITSVVWGKERLDTLGLDLYDLPLKLKGDLKMYDVDAVMNQVEDWIAQKEVEMDLEDDKQEARLIWEKVHNVKQNFQYYIRAQLEKGSYFYFCKDCGVIEFCNYVPDTKNRLLENKTCFSCDFWEVREQEYLNGNKKNTIISDGTMYSDSGATKGRNTSYNGFGGTVFKIRMLDGSKEWETNNLWCGGDIPKKYKTSTMKDTAEFIK